MKALKTALLALALPFIFHVESNAQQSWKPQPNLIWTRWAKQVRVNKALPEYPRPQLRRNSWKNLNGLWEYAITDKGNHLPSNFDGKILVPFPVESALSGVKRGLKPKQSLWYRTSLNETAKAGKRTLLHFGAVDWQATVYLNGKEIGIHTGGYSAFSFDITDQLRAGSNELLVKVYDPTDKGIGPHGKQVLNPSNIYYTPSSGIWQTVWLETVPEYYVESLKITPDIDLGVVNIVVKANLNREVVVKAAGATIAGTTNSPITIPVKNPKLWSPDDPFLYDLEVTLGEDKVNSYFGMRKISVDKDEKGIDRIMLNNKPYFNLGTLDQGFWPDGLYTAPTDEALAFDIKAIKAMGFNTIRKHIKVEPARWYYHADKLGVLVWQDMVNPNQSLPEGSKAAFEAQNKETVEQLYNYPSITTWVLFNEKWGQYDQARLTKELKDMDHTRLVNGHSGECLYVNNQLRSPSVDAYVNSDMTDVHSYPNPMKSAKQQGKAQVLGEFGGIGVPIENHLWDDMKTGWGYDGIATPLKLKVQYTAMMDSLVKLKDQGLSGSIYTQPFDVETEQNGLITYDRRVIKIPIETIRTIHKKLLPISNISFTGSRLPITVADSTTKSYLERIRIYHKGERSQQFLRQLAIMAFDNNQVEVAFKMAGEYIEQMHDPFIDYHLNFILRFTKSTSDPGFSVLYKNREKINRILGNDRADAKIFFAIENDYIKPFVKKNETPNWGNIEQTVIAKYAYLGEEVIWRYQFVYAINTSNWNLLKIVGNRFLQKYGVKRKYINSRTYNDFAWKIFEGTGDRELLKLALKMSAHSLEEDVVADKYDTYANILYRLGNRSEAIRWQAKALALQPLGLPYKETLEKMEKCLPTWRVPEDDKKADAVKQKP